MCPAARAVAFLAARAFSSSSLPSTRVRQGPEASLNAMPNFICGTVLTRASYRSSTDLMKWVWPENQVAVLGNLQANGVEFHGKYSIPEPLKPHATLIFARPSPVQSLCGTGVGVLLLGHHLPGYSHGAGELSAVPAGGRAVHSLRFHPAGVRAGARPAHSARAGSAHRHHYGRAHPGNRQWRAGVRGDCWCRAVWPA